MSQPSRLNLFLLILTTLPASAQTSPCRAHITPIPFQSRHLSPPPAAHLTKRAFIRFEYPLQDDYKLLLYSEPDDFPALHYGDRGILLMHNDQLAENVVLQSLTVLQKQDEDARDNYEALSVARACSDDDPIFFLAFAYRGDITSSDLFLSIASARDDYRVTPIPLVSGGVLDLSVGNPLAFRTWSNLFEGSCNACPTRYEITEYLLEEGTPRKVKRYRTRKLYSSDNPLFDDRLRIQLSK
jgi:hypothetical protein